MGRFFWFRRVHLMALEGFNKCFVGELMIQHFNHVSEVVMTKLMTINLYLLLFFSCALFMLGEVYAIWCSVILGSVKVWVGKCRIISQRVLIVTSFASSD